LHCIAPQLGGLAVKVYRQLFHKEDQIGANRSPLLLLSSARESSIAAVMNATD
jgi:hypothetical protein